MVTARLKDAQKAIEGPKSEDQGEVAMVIPTFEPTKNPPHNTHITAYKNPPEFPTLQPTKTLYNSAHLAHKNTPQFPTFQLTKTLDNSLPFLPT